MQSRACPFDAPIYVTLKNGKYGIIYPAMDDCDMLVTADGRYFLWIQR